MELIHISVKTKKAQLATSKADILVVGVCSDDTKPTGLLAQLDENLNGAVSALYKLGDFKAKANSTTVLYTNGDITAPRLMLVGLGTEKKLTLDVVRKAIATAANQAVKLGAKTMCVALHQSIGKQFELVQLGETLAQGLHFGAYRWDEYVTKPTEEIDKHAAALVAEIIDTDSAVIKALDKGVQVGNVIGQAQNWARTIANRPGNVIYPESLAKIAQELARKAKNIKCSVLDEKQLKTKGYGGISAVGSGSDHPPRFIILEYRGGNAKAKTIALVGKAITFDSGGISIKPSSGMEDMKLDKSGGIAVMAAIKIAAQLKLPVNILALVPSAENMPSGKSVRPGDIVRTLSGKTVEIQNTDAEGRMILCDAIAYAVIRKADYIIDIATLTGACMVALGKYKAGMMSNNDEVVANLNKAADQSGEAVWHMPCDDEYLEEMKSKIADFKNIGSRWGGACNAAAFLAQFANDTPWAHIDMAGVDLFDSPKAYTAVGSSGYGVRLLSTFVRNMAK